MRNEQTATETRNCTYCGTPFVVILPADEPYCSTACEAKHELHHHARREHANHQLGEWNGGGI